MKHIIDPTTDGIDFSRYLDYLDSIRSRLPAHIYSFAADSRHFDLQSEESLHDAWLEALTIKETASHETDAARRISIHLCLLGPFRDRRIHLHYSGVERYLLDTPARPGVPRYMHTAHGDLLTHEVRIGDSGLLVHELAFERGSTLLIECADFQHSEEKLADE